MGPFETFLSPWRSSACVECQLCDKRDGGDVDDEGITYNTTLVRTILENLLNNIVFFLGSEFVF